jgi:hypothetical protein
MKKIKYIIKYAIHLDWTNMFKIINKIHKKTGKLKIVIFFDMIFCALKYGAGYYDYQEFEFYNLSKKERPNYLTRVKNSFIIKKYNNKKSFYKFDNKGVFNGLFKDYLHRDFMVLDEKNYNDFLKFTKKHKILIVKPIDGDGGKGVDKIIIESHTNIEDLYSTLLLRKQNLVEEYINQNKKISELYPDAVNTLRLYTFYDGKDSYVINSVFKLGNGGVTDNFSSGSMYTFLDENGVVIIPAIDRNDNYFDVHPLTKKAIVGFKVPFYKEACELVKKSAKIIPDVKYVGWDVAITNDGAVIIEGNCYPGVFQIKPSLKRNMGLVPIYQKYMDIK